MYNVMVFMFYHLIIQPIYFMFSVHAAKMVRCKNEEKLTLLEGFNCQQREAKKRTTKVLYNLGYCEYRSVLVYSMPFFLHLNLLRSNGNLLIKCVWSIIPVLSFAGSNY